MIAFSINLDTRREIFNKFPIQSTTGSKTSSLQFAISLIDEDRHIRNSTASKL